MTTEEVIKAQNDVATHQLMQYASYFRRPDARAVRALTKSVALDALSSTTDGDRTTETVLFRAIPTTAGGGGAPPDHHTLAVACVAQATRERRLGGAGGKLPPPQFPVVIFHDGDGGSDGGVSVETCAAAAAYGQQLQSGGGERYKLEVAQWRELGLEELVLRGSKPVRVSYGILNGGDDGLVVVMPDGGRAAGEFLVAATVPK